MHVCQDCGAVTCEGKKRKIWPVEEVLRPAFRVWLLGARLFGTPKTAKRGNKILLLLWNQKFSTWRSVTQSQKLSQSHLEMDVVKILNNCTEEKSWKSWHQTTLLLNRQRDENPTSGKLQSWDSVRKQSFLIVCYHKGTCGFPLQLGNAASLAFRSGPYKV